jgi:hypothetical protein
MSSIQESFVFDGDLARFQNSVICRAVYVLLVLEAIACSLRRSGYCKVASDKWLLTPLAMRGRRSCVRMRSWSRELVLLAQKSMAIHRMQKTLTGPRIHRLYGQHRLGQLDSRTARNVYAPQYKTDIYAFTIYAAPLMPNT